MPAHGHAHLAVALDGAGWHPAAWRDVAARPTALFAAAYWSDLAREAERGLLDFVTVEDSLGVQPSPGDTDDGRVDQVRGRLDAALVAARVAPVTSRVRLVPTVTVTHTEPFHVSTALATLDHVSGGRAGWHVQVSASVAEAAHFGRRQLPAPGDRGAADALFDEAADAVEVVRRLWDSWEDDSVIRDVATGRFVDRDKLHYVDFSGGWFSVKGPSITPRPPQGQPVVTVLADVEVAYRLAATCADVVFVTPHEIDEASATVSGIRAIERDVGRDGEPLRIFVDLVVFLDTDAQRAVRRKVRLDELDGGELTSDAAVFTGTAEHLADIVDSWRQVGVDGFRLRPGVLPYDLAAITDRLVPVLQSRGVFRTGYEHRTLRERLGLGRPANRYAAGIGSTS